MTEFFGYKGKWERARKSPRSRTPLYARLHHYDRVGKERWKALPLLAKASTAGSQEEDASSLPACETVPSAASNAPSSAARPTIPTSLP